MSDWLDRLLGIGCAVLVVAGIGLVVLVVIARLQMEEYPVDFDAQIPPGAEVIYTEPHGDDDGLRILLVDGCAVVQEWDRLFAAWELTESSPGAFGGTRGIANVECGAAP